MLNAAVSQNRSTPTPQQPRIHESSMGSEITGKVDFVVASETYQTSFVIYGDLKGSQHRPVVIIHGGPGMAHRYMLRVFRFSGFILHHIHHFFLG